MRQPKRLLLFVQILFLTSVSLYAATPWLHVDGNQIKDPAGNVVVLRGVALIDLGFLEDWQGGAINMIDRLTDTTDTQGTSPGWYPKVIRINVTPPDSVGGWPHPFNPANNDLYNLLRTVVDYCTSKDMYVIIDWHYIANTYDHVASTSEFWEFMAPRFATDSNVLFELFNEPMNNTGGSETDRWLSVRTDMQTWIDIVRTYAPNNLILVAGPNWSQIIGPIASNPVSDPIGGNNIAVVSHIYPGHWRNPSWYKGHIETCHTVYPIIMTEWGFSQSNHPEGDLLYGSITDYGQPIMDYIESLGISNTAWVASHDWGPPMFWNDWTLRCGEGEMGCFVKDTLYLKRNDDQPGEEDIIPPDPPTGLIATAGEGEVSLDWNNNGEVDLDGYHVYRSTTSGSGYVQINASLLSSSDYTDFDVANGATYYYVVTALDLTGNESDDSSEVSATPTNTVPPANPTGLVAGTGDGTVTLDWNDNTEGDLDGYYVYRSTTSGIGYSLLNISPIVDSDYTDTNVTLGLTYYYVVTAVDAASNESGYSNEDSATPSDITPPSAPTGLTATAGNGEVWLDWNNNTEEDLNGYNVYRSTTSGSGYTQLNGSLLISSVYTDSATANGTTYYYVVTAVDLSSNESVNSVEKSATPAGQSPYPGPGAHAIPGRIEAEDYDSGGEGAAYHDTDGNNQGNAYRTAPGEGVDIQTCSDTGGGYNVGWIANGEWLEYTVDVAATGNYDIELRVASQSAGGNLHIEFNGANVTGTVSFSATGAWQTFTSINVNDVLLTSGEQIMRISMDSNDWNINWAEFTPSGLYGDFTGNGVVDIDDLPGFIALWLEDNCITTAGVDLNGDCTINLYEFSYMAQNWEL